MLCFMDKVQDIKLGISLGIKAHDAQFTYVTW